MIRNKSRFVFWSVMYIVCALFFYFFCPLNCIKIYDLLRLSYFLRGMSLFMYIGLLVIFFIGYFIVRQTKLRGRKQDFAILILCIVLNMVLSMVSLAIENIVCGGDVVETILSVSSVCILFVVSFFVFWRRKYDKLKRRRNSR